MKTEQAVTARYSNASKSQEPALCCPVDYNTEYLKAIPTEVIERDYGCGDPSRHLRPGETVLDLGSGTGKICFIASQVVGPNGRVIGIDMTDDMLEVARRNAPMVARNIGYANVEFRKGRIQDLALDLELLDAKLKSHPISDAITFQAANDLADELRAKYPLVASDSVDVVVSNCVLNLVEPGAKPQMFREIFRVLKPGGRAVISDIVADEPVPEHLQNDPDLWSGCISGALTEEAFLKAFEDAGFQGIEILSFGIQPWRTVEGIEFRSMTIRALKGPQAPCIERKQAVIYRGPFKEVLDDDGHRIERGVRYAVCDKTFNLYKNEAYRACFEFIDPLDPVPDEMVEPFDCARTARRDPKETKGQHYHTTTDAHSPCSDRGACC
ncbi:MAG: methyltransferase domain-containing protein [Verrucomicrobiia bacterium]